MEVGDAEPETEPGMESTPARPLGWPTAEECVRAWQAAQEGPSADLGFLIERGRTLAQTEEALRFGGLALADNSHAPVPDKGSAPSWEEVPLPDEVAPDAAEAMFPDGFY